MASQRRRTIFIFTVFTMMSFVLLLYRNDSNYCETNNFNYQPAAPVVNILSPSSLQVFPSFDQKTNQTFSENSMKDLFAYFRWPNSQSCNFAVDFGFNIYSDHEASAPDGHKAICLDPGVAPVYGNCLVYSFGINDEWSFDDAMAKFKCQVHSFDPSMGRKDFDRSEYVHFHNFGLGGKNGAHPVHGLFVLYTLKTIYQILAPIHGHVPIDSLKMDIEFSEWDAIPQMIDSGFLQDHVKQLAVEIHFNKDDSLKKFRQYYRILKSLENAGFVRFSSRINPWLKRNIDVLGKDEYIGFELAWYNNRFYAK